MQQLAQTRALHRLSAHRLPQSGPRLLHSVACSATSTSHMTQTIRNEHVPHAEAAWEWFRSMGSPKYWVAPMVDQSELAFRVLCRRHGARGAYTPMLHARLSLEAPGYLDEHFSTCETDRPLLAQFCANDPQVLLRAARLVEPYVDGVDLNLGCPQRIARRGRYGAFLMDDLALVERMVRTLAEGLSVPVTVKIRRFHDLNKTLEYACMLERAGASMLGIHARTREEKRASETRADWNFIRAVKQALQIPVLANGNITTLQDVQRCMEFTGADGVMSAEALLVDPALFSPRRLQIGGELGHLDGCQLLLEYLDICEYYPAPWRMVKGHIFKLLGPWLSEFTDIRETFCRGDDMSLDRVRELTNEVLDRIEASGRDYPIPKLSAKKLAAMEADAAREAAIAEQAREAAALQQLGQQLKEGTALGEGQHAAELPGAERLQLAGVGSARNG